MRVKIRERYISPILKPTLAFILALIFGSIIILIAGYDPVGALTALFIVSFGSMKAFGFVLIKTSPLLFTGLATAFSLKSGLFNAGAEGSFLLGAIMATWVGVTFTNLPPFLLVPFTLFCGAIGGALWSLIPGYLRAKHGIAELITTIMFNLIAIRLVGYLIKGPLQEPAGIMPQSAKIAENAILPFILPGTKLHLGFLIGILVSVILYIILFRTYFGYEIRAAGFNFLAAENEGINAKKNIIIVMGISGAVAGIGGAAELTGVVYRLFEGISAAYGMTAIILAILVNSNPLAVIIGAFVFGVLNAGGTAMQRAVGVSGVVSSLFQGITVIFLIILPRLSLDKLKAKIYIAMGIAGEKLTMSKGD